MEGVTTEGFTIPYLFILVTELFHLLLKKAEATCLIYGIPNIILDQSISHLQFADDTILFLKAEEETVHNVKHILGCFETFSGLSINFQKSYPVGFGINEELFWRLAALCRCKIGQLPLKYLGIPLGADPRRVATWEPTVEKFKKRLTGWKCRSMSFAARVAVLIRYCPRFLYTLCLFFRCQLW